MLLFVQPATCVLTPPSHVRENEKCIVYYANSNSCECIGAIVSCYGTNLLMSVPYGPCPVCSCREGFGFVRTLALITLAFAVHDTPKEKEHAIPGEV